MTTLTDRKISLYMAHGIDVAPLANKVLSKKIIEKLHELVIALGLGAYINLHADDIRLELLQAEATYWKDHWTKSYIPEHMAELAELAELAESNIQFWSLPVDVTTLDDEIKFEFEFELEIDDFTLAVALEDEAYDAGNCIGIIINTFAKDFKY